VTLDRRSTADAAGIRTRQEPIVATAVFKSPLMSDARKQKEGRPRLRSMARDIK